MRAVGSGWWRGSGCIKTVNQHSHLHSSYAPSSSEVTSVLISCNIQVFCGQTWYLLVDLFSLRFFSSALPIQLSFVHQLSIFQSFVDISPLLSFPTLFCNSSECMFFLFFIII